MASSPEMEPPGFELIPKPPSSEVTPSQIESLNPPTSPDEAPPGFENPNAWMATSPNDICDPPPPPASIREETMKPPMSTSGADPHVSEVSSPHLSESELEVDIMTGTMDPSQLQSAISDTKTLEPMLDQPKVETFMNCQTQTVGPSESLPMAPPKVETLHPAMLVPPPPPPHLEAPEQPLIGDGLMELHRSGEVFLQPETQIEERDFKPALKAETDIWGKEPSLEHQSALLPPVQVFKSVVPESVSESLGLPPSPPPLPLVSESVVPDSSFKNLDTLPSMPPPPPPPPALIVGDMSKSPILNSEYDNLNKKTCARGLTGDEISAEHETMVPVQPPAQQETKIFNPAMLPPPPPSLPPQLNCELVVSSVPQMAEMRHDDHRYLKEEIEEPSNHEMKMYWCSHGGGKPDMPSFETGRTVNETSDEPPPKKSRNMHETQCQLMPEACLPEVEKNSLVSETPEMDPHEEEAMEQIDMDMSDDESLYRSPTDMGPPGSDNRDSESPEEAPPGYGTIDPTSQMEMLSQDALSGMGQMVCGNCHELICYPHGAHHVLCTCCQTINLVLEACQVGTINCGQCSVLLMYPFGAPSVRCSFCRYVTEIGPHNMRPPLSVQQGDRHPTLDVSINAK